VRAGRRSLARCRGGSDGDRFGAALSGIGDADGDTVGDLAAGAPGASRPERPAPGACSSSRGGPCGDRALRRRAAGTRWGARSPGGGPGRGRLRGRPRGPGARSGAGRSALSRRQGDRSLHARGDGVGEGWGLGRPARRCRRDGSRGGRGRAGAAPGARGSGPRRGLRCRGRVRASFFGRSRAAHGSRGGRPARPGRGWGRRPARGEPGASAPAPGEAARGFSRRRGRGSARWRDGGSRLGERLSLLQDGNGDGLPDLLSGGPSASPSGRTGRGA